MLCHYYTITAITTIIVNSAAVCPISRTCPCRACCGFYRILCYCVVTVWRNIGRNSELHPYITRFGCGCGRVCLLQCGAANVVVSTSAVLVIFIFIFIMNTASICMAWPTRILLLALTAGVWPVLSCHHVVMYSCCGLTRVVVLS